MIYRWKSLCAKKLPTLDFFILRKQWKHLVYFFKNKKYFSIDLLRIWKLLGLRICGIYSEIHAAPICGIYTTRKLDQTGQGGGQGVTKGLGLDLIRYSSMQIDSKLSSVKCFRPRSYFFSFFLLFFTFWYLLVPLFFFLLFTLLNVRVSIHANLSAESALKSLIWTKVIYSAT